MEHGNKTQPEKAVQNGSFAIYVFAPNGCRPNTNERNRLQIDCGCAAGCGHDAKQEQVVKFEKKHLSDDLLSNATPEWGPNTGLYPHLKPNLAPTLSTCHTANT